MVRAAAFVVLLVGCSFTHGAVNDGDAGAGGEGGGGGGGGDGSGSGSGDLPLHLGSGDGTPGTAPLTLGGTVTIDTGALSITGASLPAGDSFDLRPQLGGGPDLAVLHVSTLIVSSGANVRIVGTHPFVVVASGDVDLSGTLDAGARGVTPGP
jgi:hypothetical protein